MAVGQAKPQSGDQSKDPKDPAPVRPEAPDSRGPSSEEVGLKLSSDLDHEKDDRKTSDAKSSQTTDASPENSESSGLEPLPDDQTRDLREKFSSVEQAVRGSEPVTEDVQKILNVLGRKPIQGEDNLGSFQSDTERAQVQKFAGFAVGDTPYGEMSTRIYENGNILTTFEDMTVRLPPESAGANSIAELTVIGEEPKRVARDKANFDIARAERDGYRASLKADGCLNINFDEPQADGATSMTLFPASQNGLKWSRFIPGSTDMPEHTVSAFNNGAMRLDYSEPHNGITSAMRLSSGEIKGISEQVSLSAAGSDAAVINTDGSDSSRTAEVTIPASESSNASASRASGSETPSTASGDQSDTADSDSMSGNGDIGATTTSGGDTIFTPLTAQIESATISDTSASISTNLDSLGQPVYLDANGKPVDLQTSQSDQPVFSVRTGEDGKQLVEIFPNAQSARENNWVQRQEVSISNNGDLTTESRSITRKAADGTTTLELVESTLNQKTGELSVTKTGDGQQQVISFDKAGNVIGFELKGKDSISYGIENGRISSASVNGQEVHGDALEQLKIFGEVTIAGIRAERGIAAPQPDFLEDLRPTAGREGKSAEGSLIIQSGDRFDTFAVEDGKIKNAQGEVIGSMTDDGAVSLNGQTLKIGDMAGSAFHGVGTDGQRLDLTSSDLKDGLTGVFYSPDGSQSLAVIGGNMYGANGEFVGRLSPDGSVTYMQGSDALPSVINSKYDGWTFNGEQSGHKRQLKSSPDLVNGSLSIPDANGTITQYDVELGMIIDRQTHEQIGWLKAPAEGPDGVLRGGSIERINADGTTTQESLASHEMASFNLQVVGATGGLYAPQQIMGVSLGAEQMANGDYRPGEGYLNIKQGMDLESKRIRWAEERIKNGEDTDVEKDRERLARQQQQIYLNYLATGRFTEDLVQKINDHVDAVETEISSPIDAQKKELDSWRSTLEALPSDTTTLNGTVRIPGSDGTTTEWTIRNGGIFDSNGNALGTIDSATGAMTMTDAATGRQDRTEMRGIEGAVWNLHFSDAQGVQQDIEWVSTNGNIYSRADLAVQQNRELQYMYQLYGDSSPQADDARARVDAYRVNINRIFESGIASDTDRQMLTRGPAEFVREHVEGEEPPQRTIIDIPTISDPTQVNGMLRIGEEVYSIRGGELFQMRPQEVNGQQTMVADTEPTGRLHENYMVELPGRGLVSLAEQNRVLMQFTMGDSPDVHQLMGMGRAKTVNGRYEAGGLVDVDQLVVQANEAIQQALHGDKQYWDNLPYATAALGDYWSNSEAVMARTMELMEQDRDSLRDSIQDTFKNGFDPTTLNSDGVNARIGMAQSVVNGLGISSGEFNAFAQSATQTQAMVNNGVVMGVMTVATAGIGSVFAGAVNAERAIALTRMARLGYMAGEVATAGVIGGAISVVGRASNSSDTGANLTSGVIEGATMGFGGALGNQLGTRGIAAVLKDFAGTGKLAAGDAAILAMRAGIYTADSAIQTVGMGVAGQVRAGQPLSRALDGDVLFYGMLSNFAGRMAGGFSFKSDFIKGVVNQGSSGFSSGLVEGMHQALAEQDAETARRFGIKLENASPELLAKYRDYDQALSQGVDAAMVAALTAAVTTTATHFGGRMLSSAGGYLRGQFGGGGSADGSSGGGGGEIGSHGPSGGGDSGMGGGIDGTTSYPGNSDGAESVGPFADTTASGHTDGEPTNGGGNPSVLGSEEAGEPGSTGGDAITAGTVESREPNSTGGDTIIAGTAQGGKPSSTEDDTITVGSAVSGESASTAGDTSSAGGAGSGDGSLPDTESSPSDNQLHDITGEASGELRESTGFGTDIEFGGEITTGGEAEPDAATTSNQITGSGTSTEFGGETATGEGIGSTESLATGGESAIEATSTIDESSTTAPTPTPQVAPLTQAQLDAIERSTSSIPERFQSESMRKKAEQSVDYLDEMINDGTISADAAMEISSMMNLTSRSHDSDSEQVPGTVLSADAMSVLAGLDKDQWNAINDQLSKPDQKLLVDALNTHALDAESLASLLSDPASAARNLQEIQPVVAILKNAPAGRTLTQAEQLAALPAGQRPAFERLFNSSDVTPQALDALLKIRSSQSSGDTIVDAAIDANTLARLASGSAAEATQLKALGLLLSDHFEGSFNRPAEIIGNILDAPPAAADALVRLARLDSVSDSSLNAAIADVTAGGAIGAFQQASNHYAVASANPDLYNQILSTDTAPLRRMLLESGAKGQLNSEQLSIIQEAYRSSPEMANVIDQLASSQAQRPSKDSPLIAVVDDLVSANLNASDLNNLSKAIEAGVIQPQDMPGLLELDGPSTGALLVLAGAANAPERSLFQSIMSDKDAGAIAHGINSGALDSDSAKRLLQLDNAQHSEYLRTILKEQLGSSSSNMAHEEFNALLDNAQVAFERSLDVAPEYQSNPSLADQQRRVRDFRNQLGSNIDESTITQLNDFARNELPKLSDRPNQLAARMRQLDWLQNHLSSASPAEIQKLVSVFAQSRTRFGAYMAGIMDSGRYPPGTEFEVLVHGTLGSRADDYVDQQGATLSESGGNYSGQFHTASDLMTSVDFATGRASDPKSNPFKEDPAVVGIAIPVDVFNQLQKQGLVHLESNNELDGEQLREYIFEPEAIQYLKENGFFYHLDIGLSGGTRGVPTIEQNNTVSNLLPAQNAAAAAELARNSQGQLINELGQRVNEQAQVIDSKGNPIETEFPNYPVEEFARVRPNVVDDLKRWKSIEGNNVGNEFEALTNRLGFSDTERNQIVDGLTTVREHGARMREIDPEQEINWKHTQREFGAAIDYAARNGFNKAETQDLLFAAMFSDGLKTKFNFTTHNLDGAAAFDQFAKTHLPNLSAERKNGIRQAILEHQVAPPQFMSMIYGGAIMGSFKAEGREMTSAETAALASLKTKMSDPLAFNDADLIDVAGGPAGAKALKLTSDEQALLARVGLDNWYVPHDGNSWNKFSRGLIDSDGIDNYAGPGGLSKIVGLRGPEKAVYFQDRHVLFGNPSDPSQISSFESWKQSQLDFLGNPAAGKHGVATEQTRVYVEQQSARMQQDIAAARARVNDWINSPAGSEALGLPLTEAIEKIPGWTGTKENPDLLDYSTATPEELSRARKIWDKFANELAREQRVELQDTPEYGPLMQN